MNTFGRIGMKRPEDFPKLFEVYKHETETSDRGRTLRKAPELIGNVKCTLSIASPDEQQRFHQIGVTVTHTIFHPGKPIARENDIFVLSVEGKPRRFFRVQAVHDHGEMDVFTTYYCEERGDIRGL